MQQPLDIVYLFRHSPHRDLEIRYSLRSVAQNLPFIRKVWIFGDRSHFLAADKFLVEHVSHEYIAPLLGLKTPVRNDFLLLALASLIPGLAFDFLRFSDDYVILQPLSREELCTVRAVEDLSQLKHRGSGKWRDMLWRTHETLREHGYSGINFESHTPQYMTRQHVFEAFMAFRPFLSEDRHQGLLSNTTIGNNGLRHHNLAYTFLADNPTRIGFHGSCPTEPEIAAACQEKLFLNFDDPAFAPPLQNYLHSRFPNRCRYERLTPE